MSGFRCRMQMLQKRKTAVRPGQLFPCTQKYIYTYLLPIGNLLSSFMLFKSE